MDNVACQTFVSRSSKTEIEAEIIIVQHIAGATLAHWCPMPKTPRTLKADPIRQITAVVDAILRAVVRRGRRWTSTRHEPSLGRR
jgi:hypothetical protein